MARRASPRTAPERSPFRALIEAIAAGDSALAERLLRATPALATATEPRGATRGDPTNYFFDAIRHYVYEGDTTLHVAAAAYQAFTARALLDLGADVHARNRRGAEPLHYAVDGGPGSPTWHPAAQTSTMSVLLDAGADPRARDNDGVSALHRAVRTRCSEAVRVLLERGGDPSGASDRGSTPLHLAVQTTGRGGSGSTDARSEQEKIIELLLSHGARVDALDARGRSVLSCAKDERIRELLSTRRRGK